MTLSLNSPRRCCLYDRRLTIIFALRVSFFFFLPMQRYGILRIYWDPIAKILFCSEQRFLLLHLIDTIQGEKALRRT